MISAKDGASKSSNVSMNSEKKQQITFDHARGTPYILKSKVPICAVVGTI